MREMIGTRHTFASYFALAVDTILKVLWREGFARGPQELVPADVKPHPAAGAAVQHAGGLLASGDAADSDGGASHLTPIGPLRGPISAERRGRRDGSGAGSVGVSAGAGVGSCGCWRR